MPRNSLGRAVTDDGSQFRRDAPERRFVGSYLLLGGSASVFACCSALVYLIATPNGVNRQPLFWCVSAGLVLGALSTLLVRRFVGTRWESTCFLGWTAATMVLICVATVLDGGVNSPLSWLLILPVVYASIDYPVSATVSIAVAAAVAQLTMMAYSHDWAGRDWFQALVVLMFGAMAISAAITRSAYAVAERRMTAVAMRDGLTGCLANAVFHDRMRSEEARALRSERPFSLVMCDADGFKTINDTCGHDVGDETLKLIARALMGVARAGDDVGRLGGDEFCILLAETDMSQAQAVACRLSDALHGATFPTPTTLSMGLATWSGPMDSAIATLRRADQAMYEAKRQGGDRLMIAAEPETQAADGGPASSRKL